MLKLRPDVKTIADPYSGEEVVAFPALRPDVAVLHALKADRAGNAVLGKNQAIDPELALGAPVVVITAEEIVDELDEVDIVAPVVTAVAHAPRGAWPTSCHPLYAMGGGELMRYMEACGAKEFDAYVRERLAVGVA
jgi:glutaconate CoA-transferase subunit A